MRFLIAVLVVVLALVAAEPRDGGSGAVLVLLGR
jgi:DNA-nicking Smr family endonuclease